MGFSIAHTTATYPTLPYKKIAEDIMGNDYSLSLVFIGTQRARTLNQTYRNKSYVPNVLSFPLDDTHGEIFITPAIARREAKKRDLTYRTYVAYLFIHALLHLKGYQHSARMERAEARYLQRHGFAR